MGQVRNDLGEMAEKRERQKWSERKSFAACLLSSAPTVAELSAEQQYFNHVPKPAQLPFSY